MTLHRESLNWSALIWWAGITSVGWAGYSVLLLLLTRYALLETTSSYWNKALMLVPAACGIGVVFGMVTGLGQGLILRRLLGVGIRSWTIATAVGWGAVGLVYWDLWFNLWYNWEIGREPNYIGAYWWIPTFFFLPLLITWAIPALGQWQILRLRVDFAGWWVVTNAFGWYLATYVSWNLYEYVFKLTDAIMAQAAMMLVGGLTFAILISLSIKILLDQTHEKMNINIVLWSANTGLSWVLGMVPASLAAVGLLPIISSRDISLFGSWSSGSITTSYFFCAAWGAIIGIYATVILGPSQQLILGKSIQHEKYTYSSEDSKSVHIAVGQHNKWIRATFIGLILGGSLGGVGVTMLTRLLGLPAGLFGPWLGCWTILGAIIGAVIGLCQWWVLRGWVQRAELWILISSVGWATGVAVFWLIYKVSGGPLNEHLIDPSLFAGPWEWPTWSNWFVSLLVSGLIGGIITGFITGKSLRCLLGRVDNLSLE